MMRYRDNPLGLMILIAAQLLCAAFFLLDVVADGLELQAGTFLQTHFLIEAFAALSLIAAVVVEARFLMALLRRKAHLERQVSLAAGALQDVIQAYYTQWRLTPSEQDVASFIIKGFSISEIAELRGSAEGTIKSHLNSIYRKSGTAGRGALVSLLIEEILDGALTDQDRARPAPHANIA